MTSTTPPARSWTSIAIIVLMLPELVSILSPLSYSLSEGWIELVTLAASLAVFTLLTIAGLWWRKSWALWAVLVVVSFQCTIDLGALAQHIQPTLALISLFLLGAITVLVFVERIPSITGVSVYQRILFGFVFLFAAWVAAWGLFLPARIGSALPLSVPPLHARFLGAMYLSGSIFMLLGMMARTWSAVRVVTLILAMWTGMLGLVSALHLEAFDWSGRSTWFWFVAYIAYPLIALWITWCQLARTESEPGRPVPALLKRYLNVQGLVALAFALCLLVAPKFMATIWPWPISPLVAQIYGAPFLSYGLGSLYAARHRTWREVRIVILGTLAFAVGVLAASILHSSLFNPRGLSAWLWFGGFGTASLVLMVFSVVPSLGGTGQTEHA